MCGQSVKNTIVNGEGKVAFLLRQEEEKKARHLEDSRSSVLLLSFSHYSSIRTIHVRQRIHLCACRLQ